MSKHTKEELKQWQSLPLNIKVRMTENRIRGWLDEFGTDGVYISFSGGKDSTVLVDIVDKLLNKIGIDKNQIPLVFVDTGLEYPEIRQFVKLYGDRVTWVRPEMNFKQVIEKYGYPFFGKETAEVVYNAKRYLKSVVDGGANTNTITKDLQDKVNTLALMNPSRGGQTQNIENSVDLVSLAKSIDKWKMPYRVSIMLGTFETHWNKKKLGIIPKDGEPSRAKYSQVKYQFMLNAPFDISHMCCNVMKKKPVHKYAKETGRKPITAQMAEESMLRTQKWLQNGCNSFEGKNPISNPMSFWTNQDVLRYIKENNLPICSVYGDVVECGQLSLFEEPRLETTGCNRTGCMFCGFGCHLEKPHEARFVLMKQTHPYQYEYIMKPWEDGGLDYKNKIDWINENGNMDIRY